MEEEEGKEEEDERRKRGQRPLHDNFTSARELHAPVNILPRADVAGRCEIFRGRRLMPRWVHTVFHISLPDVLLNTRAG